MKLNYKAVLITRQTRFEALIKEYNTQDQAEFVIESRGDNFSQYQLEHETYIKSVQKVKQIVGNYARVQQVDRTFLPNFLFGPDDIVIVVGQDGLVANTLKYLDGQSLIAVNPDPTQFDGILLPFTIQDVDSLMSDVVKKKCRYKEITMAKAMMNDGQELIAVNDLFIGPRYQTSARYDISIEGKTEYQCSSGVIISTGLGSTGWMKSVVTGASALLGGAEVHTESLSWDSNALCYAVREPFPSRTTGTQLVYGNITQGRTMTLSSKVPNDGVIFSDGMIDDYLDFNSGAELSISVSDRVGKLVV